MASYKEYHDTRSEKQKLSNVTYDFTDKCRRELEIKAREGIRGWDDPEKFSDEDLAKKLQSAVDRKDAVAVANYAMFMYYRNAEQDPDTLAMNDMDAGFGW